MPRVSPIAELDADEFSELVQESESLGEILLSVGLSNKGGNYKTLMNRINAEGHDISHIKEAQLAKQKERLVNHNIRRYSYEETFCENSKVSRRDAKARIISDNLFPYECTCCGNKGEWNGQPLTLHLDHINGVHNDHRLSNLRFLCPNCHSQTETYGGRNTRTSAHCKDCDAEITKHTKNGRCVKCKAKAERKVVNRPDANVLKSDIKQLGFVGTGKKYGVSDNAVRKWAKQYGIL